MNIDINDRVTLSNDKRYIVISKINYEDKIYYFLNGFDDKTDIKICLEDVSNSSLVVVKDRDLIDRLFPLFLKKSEEVVSQMMKDEDN